MKIKALTRSHRSEGLYWSAMEEAAAHIGFARRSGGRAKAVIGRFIAPQMLDPEAPTAALTSLVLCEKIGPLPRSDCDPVAWRILVTAAGTTIRNKVDVEL